jgi:hypothetical protein
MAPKKTSLPAIHYVAAARGRLQSFAVGRRNFSFSRPVMQETQVPRETETHAIAQTLRAEVILSARHREHSAR